MATTPQQTEAETTPAAPPGDSADRIPLTPEWREYFADVDWVLQEYNAGRWAPYTGEYIAVVRKQLLGHGPSLLKLREDVARETGIRPGRIHIIYVEPPIEC